MADVIDKNGDGLDLSDDISLLISAALTGEITGYTPPGQMPNSETDVSRSTLVPWLRNRNLTQLADSLDGPSYQAPGPPTTPAAPKASTNTKQLATAISLSRASMIAHHKASWPSIEGDIRDARSNGLAQAKAGVRGWDEAKALEWARAKNKLKQPSTGDALMNVWTKPAVGEAD